MGALVTLELPDDSPIHQLPWIITFGPLEDDDEWEPVVCGPYERPHALALAESVVVDEELMAVVEPVLPATAPDQIRQEIMAAKLAAEDEAAQADDAEIYGDYEETTDERLHAPDEEERHAEPLIVPTEEELQAGFKRIAAMLTGIDRNGSMTPPPGGVGSAAAVRSSVQPGTPGTEGTGS